MPNGLKIEFTDIPGNVHVCTSFVSGEWVVFKCPFCDEYERRYNFRTGEMCVKGMTDFSHVGQSWNGLPDMTGLKIAAYQKEKLN